MAMWLNNFSSVLSSRTCPEEKTTTRKVACSEGILFGRIKNTIFLFSHHLWCWKQRETGVERRIIMGGGGRGKAECKKMGCLSHPLPFSPFYSSTGKQATLVFMNGGGEMLTAISAMMGCLGFVTCQLWWIKGKGLSGLADGGRAPYF